MDGLPPVTADLIRAARVLLKLEEDELARRADLSVEDLRRVEEGSYSSFSTVLAIREALQQAGIEFLPDGVRKITPAPAPAERLARINQIVEEFSRLPVLDPRSGDEIIADLYDENGLPK